MTTMKHTPGPWTVLPGITSGDIITPMGRVASCVTLTTDAHLIAAAPALLEALEAIDLLMDMGDEVPDNTAFTFDDSTAINAAFAQARAAIKLARGDE